MKKDELKTEVVVIDDPEFEAKIEAQEDHADYDALSGYWSGFWEPGALEAVKEAAARQGVPYLTYIKQAALRQANKDLAG